MEIYILSKVNNIVHIDDHGTYRDDGLIIKDKMNPLGKSSTRCLKRWISTLQWQSPGKFFQTHIYLLAETILLFMKPNTVLRCANIASSHPSSVIKLISLDVQCRPSKNSSNEEISIEKKYVSVLKEEVQIVNICFKDQVDQRKSDNRKRKNGCYLILSNLQHISKNQYRENIF